jgi:hypothetical protein
MVHIQADDSRADCHRSTEVMGSLDGYMAYCEITCPETYDVFPTDSSEHQISTLTLLVKSIDDKQVDRVKPERLEKEVTLYFLPRLLYMAAPPFTRETAREKVKKAQDLWNTRYTLPHIHQAIFSNKKS